MHLFLFIFVPNKQLGFCRDLIYWNLFLWFYDQDSGAHTYWDDHCDWLDNHSKGARSGGRGLVDVTPLQKGWKTLWDPEASSQTVPLKIVGIYTKITGEYFPNNLSGLNLVIGVVLHKHRQENIMSPAILSNSEAVYLGSFSDALFNTQIYLNAHACYI